MVGANALLGETLRVALPELARETGRGWKLAPSGETYPAADENDPLKDHDDPATDAMDGILARDGGHFEARFVSGAEAFADAAGCLLRSCLPGLRFRVLVNGEGLHKSQVRLSTELPVLAPCQWTGRGIASVNVTQGNEHPDVSLDVERRHAAARRTEEDKAVDVASLLSDRTKLKELNRAQELKELVGNGYLALIHADGNGVGSGAGKTDGERAEFFHRNRVLLRRALKKAIDAHCPDTGTAPFIPLMLGGDDLLLVSRAEIALPFIVTLCAGLDAIQQDRAGFKLTLGIGAVIAKHTIPIHRLHEVAERLASSAKRRFRGRKDDEPKRSVVDWAVYSTAWVDDPEYLRRRDWLRGSGNELRVLSQRPVDVLGGGIDSLQGLVRRAEKLKDAPRSQLRYLVDQLPHGRVLSELAFAELSVEAKKRFEEAGVQTPWRRAANNGPWLTALLDLVEITEIARLGRKAEPADSRREVAHV
ncbi:MAG: Cas10/Cmr2 second palm domain-containing protein [Isosphaeraceae bacterium]